MKKSKLLKISLATSLAVISTGVITTALTSCGSSNDTQQPTTPPEPPKLVPSFGNKLDPIKAEPEDNRVYKITGHNLSLVQLNNLNLYETYHVKQNVKFAIMQHTDELIKIKVLKPIFDRTKLELRYNNEIVSQLLFFPPKAEFNILDNVEVDNKTNQFAITGEYLGNAKPSNFRVVKNGVNLSYVIRYTTESQILIEITSELDADAQMQCYYNDQQIATLIYKKPIVIDDNPILSKHFIFSDQEKTNIIGLTEEAKQTPNLIIPNQVKSFDSTVFQNLVDTQITSLDFRRCNEMVELPIDTFKNSSNITTLLLPPNLKTIDKSQINDLKNITRINWPAPIDIPTMTAATWELPIFIPSFNANPGAQLNLSEQKTRNGDSGWVSIYNKPNGVRIYLVPKEYGSIAYGWHPDRFWKAEYLYFQDESCLSFINNDTLRWQSLKRIVFPKSLKILNAANLWDMNELLSIESEDHFKNLSSVGGWCFMSMSKLKYLNMYEANFKKFAAQSFGQMGSLEYFILPKYLVNLKPDGQEFPYLHGFTPNLKYMPMPQSLDFDISNLNNQTTRYLGGALRFRIPDGNNKVDYSDLYEDKEQLTRGIWVDGLSTEVNHPDRSKLPNLKFISYRDKTEYFGDK